MKRDRKHFVLPDTKAEKYRPHKRVIPPKRVPAPQDPVAHARRLRKALTDAQLALLAIKQRPTTVVAEATTKGMYLEFEGFPLHELKLQSLEATRSGIELLSVSRGWDSLTRSWCRSRRRARTSGPRSRSKSKSR